MSFCDEKGLDSAYIQIPTYEQDLEKYSAATTEGYSIDLLGYLNLMFFNVKELQGKIGDVEAIGKDMLKSFTGSHVNEPTGNAKLDEMQEYYNKSKDLQDRQAQLSKLAVNPQLLFLFDAHNQDGTLIDGTTNAARSLDKRLKITRGIVNIRVVHAPADEGTKSRRKPLQKQ